MWSERRIHIIEANGSRAVSDFDDIKAELIALLPRLRAYGRAITRDASAADDLVQTACEKALRNLASYQRGSRLDAWMFRIMKNAWIDNRRANRNLHLLGDDEAVEAHSEEALDQTEAHLELKSVARAMAEMTTEQREVLLLIGVNGMKYRDAAEALDVPIGTVMSRLARARQTLASMMGYSERPALREKKL